MSKTTFTVTNNVPGQTQDHVLVFLKPINASSNFQFYAWQDLNPCLGASQSFDYLIDLSVEVFDPTAYQDKSGAIAQPVKIEPGQLYAAVNTNGQSPWIDTSTNLNSGNVLSTQAAIVNQCTNGDCARIGLSWYNCNHKVVTVGAAANDILNVGKTITLEFEPTLYFMAAAPTLTGPNFTLQDYSNMTPYTLKAGTPAVTVMWSRTSKINSADVFTFNPASAVIGR